MLTPLSIGELMPDVSHAIENELDIMWREIVVARSGGRCQLCAKPGQDPHHIFGRVRSVRWEVENGAYLCRVCHRMVTDAYRPMVWRYLLTGTVEVYDRLEALRNRPDTYKPDYGAIKESLTTERARLKEVLCMQESSKAVSG